MNCLMVSHVGLEMILVYMETLKGGTMVISPLSRWNKVASRIFGTSPIVTACPSMHHTREALT